MRNELDIPLTNAQLDANFHATDLSLHMLPLGQILLCIKKRKKNDNRLFEFFELILLKKNGDLLKFKQLNSANNIIRVNQTNIFVYDKTSAKLDKYDFNLELVHSHSLDYGNDYDMFCISEYDLAFNCRSSSFVDCFSFKTTQIRKKKIFLDEIEYLNFCGLSISSFKKIIGDFFLRLLDLNENFIFIYGSSFEGEMFFSSLFVLNREDNDNLISFFTFNSPYPKVCIYNRDFCAGYKSKANDGFRLKVYDARSSSSGLNNVCDEALTGSEEQIFLDIFRSLDHRKVYSFISIQDGYFRFKIY